MIHPFELYAPVGRVRLEARGLFDEDAGDDLTGQEFIVVYHGEHNGPFRYPSEEISAVEFFPVDIINRWVANKPEDFAPGFLESWRLANANLA